MTSTTEQTIAIMSLLSLLNWESFSSVWFWVILLGQWSLTGLSVLGVPVDVLNPHHPDAKSVVEYRLRRHVELFRTAPFVMVLIVAAGLGCMLILAVIYQIELAQAICFLTLPMLILWFIGYRVAEGCIAAPLELQIKRLKYLHIFAQVFGLMVIFITVVFVLAQHLTTPF